MEQVSFRVTLYCLLKFKDLVVNFTYAIVWVYTTCQTQLQTL